MRVHNQLADERIVIRADRIAFVDVRVEPHTGAAGPRFVACRSVSTWISRARPGSSPARIDPARWTSADRSARPAAGSVARTASTMAAASPLIAGSATIGRNERMQSELQVRTRASLSFDPLALWRIGFERPDDVLLGTEVALGDQTQYQILPRRFVHG